MRVLLFVAERRKKSMSKYGCALKFGIIILLCMDIGMEIKRKRLQNSIFNVQPGEWEKERDIWIYGITDKVIVFSFLFTSHGRRPTQWTEEAEHFLSLILFHKLARFASSDDRRRERKMKNKFFLYLTFTVKTLRFPVYRAACWISHFTRAFQMLCKWVESF